MAAGAAPEVPVLAYLAVGLLAMLSWLVLRGLAGAWRHTFGWLLEQLGGVLRIDVAFVHWHPGNKLIDLSNAMLHVLTAGAAKSEHAMGYFFHGAAVLQEWASRELLGFAHEVLGWAGWLQHVHLPRWARGLIAAAYPPALIARLIRSAITAALPHILRLAHAAAHGATVTITRTVTVPHLAELQWIHRHWRALTAAIAAAGAIAIPAELPWIGLRHRTRALEHDLPHIYRRLHRLEGLFGATAMALAMANALGLGRNWRCIRGGNIGRLARLACGFPSWLMDLLVLGAVEGLVTLDLCDFSYLLRQAAAAEVPALMQLVAVEDALIGCHGATKPPPLTLAPAALPPLQAPSPLAA